MREGRRLSQRASSVHAERVRCLYTPEELEFLISPCFFFCFVWSIRGSGGVKDANSFSRFCEDLFDEFVSLPRGVDVLDLCLNIQLKSAASLAARRSISGVHTPEEELIPNPHATATAAAAAAAAAAGGRAENKAAAKETKIKLNDPQAIDRAKRHKAYFTSWEKTIPHDPIDPTTNFSSLLIPCKETIRTRAMIDLLIKGKIPILLTGTKP